MRVSALNTRWFPTACAGLLAAVAACLAIVLTHAATARAGGQSLSQLNSELGANQATQSNLSADVHALDGQISALNGQISVVRSRERAVQDALAADRSALDSTRSQLAAQQRRLARLRATLARARMILSRQLVSSYEQPQDNLVSVVLSSHGFSQMLDQIQYLQTAEHSQQTLISFTTRAKAAATAAADRLNAIQSRQATETAAASTQANALAGMNGLLTSRQNALGDIESARATALSDARAKGASLRSAISTIKAQQAAAARAAAAAAARAAAAAAAASTSSGSSSSASSSSSSAPASAAASGGWAIPASVVMCESGGQNLPPNSAGASGYYQILPSTWTGEGGSGPAAYLAPKSEQDAIAAKLWNGGAGASNWVCAGIVGIT